MTHVRHALLATALALAVLGSSAPLAAAKPEEPAVLDSSLKLHPMLQVAAQSDPAALVRVIVQKTKRDVKTNEVLDRVPSAQSAEEYEVIPAFVATLPASSLAALAANSYVRYITPDGAVQVISGKPANESKKPAPPKPPKPADRPKHGLNAHKLLTTFPFDTGATGAWSGKDAETGAGIAVAMIDSGLDFDHPDVDDHVLAINVNRGTRSASDGYGHGTHVAGIIKGFDPDEHYLGIAPNATLISVKVSDDSGASSVSDLLRGLDWVSEYRDTFKIRALNISASVSFPESYATSPVDAAVERLWNDGVTVVTSAGNRGSAEDAVWYAPGNDPQVITVGCLDENQTTTPEDDSLCAISSRGLTEDGFAKPDLVAPGRKIVSALAAGHNGRASSLEADFPERVSVDRRHISMSGTSMAAPMVTGAIALLLDRKGDLKPNQIKQLLVRSARAYPGQLDDAGALNITAALAGADHPPANSRQVLQPVGGTPSSTATATILWDGARWTTAYWDGARWTTAYWDGARWTAAHWDGARWTAAHWDGARWTTAYWDGARWTSSSWTGARWTSSAP